MLRKFLLSLTTVLSVSASATHFSGGEIYWHCLGNNQYEITMVVYRDCAGINVDPNVTLAFQSPCGNTSLVVSTPSGVEISQLCDLELPNSTCNGGSLPGIQQYIYTGTITLAPCDSWTISYTNIYRNNAIVNLQNPGTQRTYIRAVLNTTVSPCNDSPQFSNTAIPFVCLGYPISYSFGAFDPEGDSLSYVLIDAMGLNGAPIPYVNPNTGNTPIPGLTLDPVTGQVNFTLATQGNWVVVVQVNHWVNGVLVGSIMRDMQFVAYPCTNDPPDASTGLIQNLSGTAVQLGPRAIQVCESGNFCFDFVISDPNLPNVLDAFSNIQQNLPGATFTFNGFNPITCTVCWNATAGTSGYFPFIVNVNDGACPIPAFQTYVYQVTVIPGLYGNIATTNASCIGNTDGTATASVTTGTAPFTYVWSTGATTPSIAGGPGSYTVTMTDVNNCVSPVLTGVISSNGLPNQANAGPDASACVNNAPISLNGSVVNATGGSWSGGSGGFSGTWPNITYTPTVAEISAGSVTLTLNTTGNTGCPPASDQMVLTLVNSFANTSIIQHQCQLQRWCNRNSGRVANEPVVLLQLEYDTGAEHRFRHRAYRRNLYCEHLGRIRMLHDLEHHDHATDRGDRG
ncbi:MAG: SprB repeat-containing protein [Flavobacteriales bacterium]|nr:SprB repeat-containing protein [Flavobacteriales bacterium]